MVRWLFYFQKQHIAHLEAEVQFWRKLYEHERGRSEDAISKLLAVQVGIAPIIPQQRTEPPPPLTKEERALQEQINFDLSMLGRVPEGVG